jgi:hypothetical protein
MGLHEIDESRDFLSGALGIGLFDGHVEQRSCVPRR